MVPMYIHLENLENWLNVMRFAPCLAIGIDRIILLYEEIASWDFD